VAKKTAIIDIGSNSISLVIYEKSSRYAFHLIEKIRSSVRIGEGAYHENGLLTNDAMQKAYGTLKDFISVTKSIGCRKILCVATSALRDAPNRDVFLKKIDRELGLRIKIIDGKKEAYLGAVAAINLLPKIDNATTIDIGGGSTELAKIENGKIIDTVSLDIGTVRLKELYGNNHDDIQNHLDDYLRSLPHLFNSNQVIGIGGTIRALSSAILKDIDYPIDSLHAFEFSYFEHKDFIQSMAKADIVELEKSSISKSRYDTICQGSMVFYTLCDRLKTKDVVVSKAGIREGVYLSDILRNTNHRFPHNFNISIKSLVDRFAIYNKNISHVSKTVSKIYEQTHKEFDVDKKYFKILLMASKLLLITRRLNIYSNSNLGFNFLLENLNFALSHKEKILIASMLKFAHKKGISSKEIKRLNALLPEKKIVKWLSFILSLTVCINRNKKIQNINIVYKDNTIEIESREQMFLTHECIEMLIKPDKVNIIIK
jgi:exopolyphosphatase/guanosine-5'-triphosphate,3'-diphosphate pyrophosphatase